MTRGYLVATLAGNRCPESRRDAIVERTTLIVPAYSVAVAAGSKVQGEGVIIQRLGSWPVRSVGLSQTVT